MNHDNRRNQTKFPARPLGTVLDIPPINSYTMDSFAALIQSDTPVLVDFYADWCGPCKAMSPIIKEVADAVRGTAKVIKVDIDKSNGAATLYQVSAVPTFIIFRRGKIVWRHSGMIGKANLIAQLKAVS
jgi:thioredoxin